MWSRGRDSVVPVATESHVRCGKALKSRDGDAGTRFADVRSMLHLTSRSSSGFPLADDAVASQLWVRVRRSWPEAHACCFMGNHVHLLVDDDERRARRTLARLVAAVPGWTNPTSPAPELVPDTPRKVLRMIRYIHLNPCRAGLVRDPLEWRWSTHRDVMGAIVDPWVTMDRLARWTSWSPDELHAYISADPSVAVDGTHMPTEAPRNDLPVRALGEIAKAAMMATRGAGPDLRRRTSTRRVFLHLAREQGWTSAGTLARACAMTRRGVLYDWTLDVSTREAALCLGDERLLR